MRSLYYHSICREWNPGFMAGCALEYEVTPGVLWCDGFRLVYCMGGEL